jgi:hypothetical protein
MYDFDTVFGLWGLDFLFYFSPFALPSRLTILLAAHGDPVFDPLSVPSCLVSTLLNIIILPFC